MKATCCMLQFSSILSNIVLLPYCIVSSSTYPGNRTQITRTVSNNPSNINKNFVERFLQTLILIRGSVCSIIYVERIFIVVLTEVRGWLKEFNETKLRWKIYSKMYGKLRTLKLYGSNGSPQLLQSYCCLCLLIPSEFISNIILPSQWNHPGSFLLALLPFRHDYFLTVQQRIKWH